MDIKKRMIIAILIISTVIVGMAVSFSFLYNDLFSDVDQTGKVVLVICGVVAIVFIQRVLTEVLIRWIRKKD